MNNVAKLRNLQTRERKALMALVGILRKKFLHSIRHVMLFGSKARGDSDPESDIDLLVVVEEYCWALEKEFSRISTQTDHKYKVVLSDHIVSIAAYKYAGPQSHGRGVTDGSRPAESDR